MRACSIFRRDTAVEYWVGVRVSFMSALSPGWGRSLVDAVHRSWVSGRCPLCYAAVVTASRSAAQMHQAERQRRLDRRGRELARVGGPDAVVLREALARPHQHSTQVARTPRDQVRRIDHESSTPLYVQLAALLRAQ